MMMQAIAESGAAFTGTSAMHLNLFGLNPVVAAGTAEQKARLLPPLIKGDDRACFAVTEPNARLGPAGTPAQNQSPDRPGRAGQRGRRSPLAASKR